MVKDRTISLRVVSDDEIPVWVRLAAARSLAEPGAGIDDEAEGVELFGQAPEQWRQISYLAWRGSQAVARLRLGVHGTIGEVWGLDLASEVRVEGLDAALIAAIETLARTKGITRLFPEVAPGDAALFIKAGYHLGNLRIEMMAEPVRRPVVYDRALRHPRPDDEADVEALGRLYYNAYRGAIDDIGQSPADALNEARETLAGYFGRFLADCSFVLDGHDGLAGATLVTEASDDTALLAEVMVHPGYRGRGYARPLIQAAMNACLDQGWQKMILTVTRNNAPAEGLYRRMGFEEEPGTEFYQLEKKLAG
jgi:GNAT superfamily N-acetyltransferase